MICMKALNIIATGKVRVLITVTLAVLQELLTALLFTYMVGSSLPGEVQPLVDRAKQNLNNSLSFHVYIFIYFNGIRILEFYAVILF